MFFDWWRKLVRGESNVSRRTRRKLLPQRRTNVKPWVEGLEGRLAPANFTVTSLPDLSTDTGSLRYAINQANTNGQDNTIRFAVDGVIPLSSRLELSGSNHQITIDGSPGTVH